MWPLTGLEVVRACGAAEWPPLVESLVIAGVSLAAPAASDEVFIALREDGYDGHGGVVAALESGAPFVLVARDWGGIDGLDPDQRSRCVVVGDTLTAFRRLAAFMRSRFTFPVVAVGGSNGKTTTKDMIAALLAAPGAQITSTPETMNGWSGLAVTLTQRAHSRESPPQGLVVEIGIDAKGAMEEHARLVDADVAVLTALGPEHLAGLGSLEDVVREEMKLFHQSAKSKRVFQTEDPSLRAEAAKARAGDVLVCTKANAAKLGGRSLAVVVYEVSCPTPTSSEVDVSWIPAGAGAPLWTRRFHVPMAGRHNGDNFAAAAAVALALGRHEEELVAGLEAFEPPSMRCEVRELENGCVLVDDAYNASPSSMHAAFELLAAPAWKERAKVVILGDMLDLGEAGGRHHLDLCAPLEALASSGARVCLFGQGMRAVHEALAARAAATEHLPADADPRAFLDGVDLRLEESVVLVKGSRGMHLERVVAEIVARSSHDEVDAFEAALARHYGRFQTACVTGTNGKTTTTSLIAAIVEAAGEPAGCVTTLGAWVAGEQAGEKPTGEAFVRTLDLAAARGVKTLAIETTSQALGEGFSRSWPARVAVFTNLSRDHLDYHGTPERYLAAKAQLFMGLPSDGVAILNVADPASALLDEVTPPAVRRLGYAARAPDPECAAIPLTLYAEHIAVDETGTHARLAASPFADALGGRLDLALVGDVHVENALAAALAGSALGYGFDAIREGLAKFAGVPGRFQVVHRRPLVVVDFAHTTDALRRTLSVARSLVAARQGRVLCVFGCGGDRDPGKREEMGAVAARGADVVVITSDNPRSEDPAAIADVVQMGASASEGNALLIRLLDRGEAIARAVELATSVDIVVIAGKGHEKTQIVGDRELPFDDVEVALEAAARREVESR